MGSPGWLKSLAAVAAVGVLGLLVAAGPALAQFPGPRPVVVPYVAHGNGGDLAGFLVGGAFLLMLLTAVLGGLVLPALIRAVDGRVNQAACFGVAAPLSAALLWLLWTPLHLTEVIRWGWGLFLIALVLGIVIAFLCTVGRGAVDLFRPGKVTDDSAVGWFLLFVIGGGTVVAMVKTGWGFWHSLLVGGGCGLGGLLAVGLVVDLARLAIRGRSNANR